MPAFFGTRYTNIPLLFFAGEDVTSSLTLGALFSGYILIQFEV